MTKKAFICVIMIVTVVTLSTAINNYAGTKVADVIRLENKSYKKHKEQIVMFQHRKHQQEYRKKNPGFFNSTCGECHHDKDNKALVKLKEGDNIKLCIECHKKADYIDGKEAKGLSHKEKREYQANAMHDNCKECHKKFNKKNGLKSKDKGYAPSTCKTCHAKK
jgi:predicted CXXCH cytochrome family protein